ncbi:MAG TPA: hypothetical protein VM425_20070 [Myxococcota bacterium]|nr:hypothetical protein [Myxococcota bacterium]
MKKLLKLGAVLVLAVVALGVLAGWGWERKPVVTSRALPCVEMGAVLVCFDGQPEAEVRCKNLGDSTILCTNSN